MRDSILELSALRGISGREHAVRGYLIRQIEGIAPFEIDALGNLLVHKKGQQRPKNKVMLAAHMDEVGMLVSYVTDEGLIKFSTVGGINTAVLVGKAVEIGEGAVKGVIGLKPVHFLNAEERKKLPERESLTIDIGTENREQALELAQIGDEINFYSEALAFGEGYLKGPALDDRAGCAVLLELIRSDLPYDLDFAFTVQEEVGARGAAVAAFGLAPDYAIVVETTTAADLPGIEAEKRVCLLGRGAAVPFMDLGTVYDRDLYRRALALAAERGIAAQPKTQVAGGTDAGTIHKSRAGVKTLTVSIPCRYLHSPSCVIRESDAESVLQLVKALAEEFAGVGG